MTLLACAAALSVACGNREAPKPPPQRIPQPVRDLTVTQRGEQLRFSLTYPQTTISGLPIDDIVAIELWEFQMPVPDFVGGSSAPSGEEGEGDGDADAEGVESEAGSEGSEGGEPTDETPVADEEPITEETSDSAEGETDEGAEGESEAPEEDADADRDDDDDDDGSPKELLLEVDSTQFVAAASKRVILEGEELANAIKGDKIEFEHTLARIEPGEKEALVYAVKTFQILKRASAFSNLARIIPRVTPEPPGDIEAKPDAKGVQLTWSWEGDEPKEYRIYRRDPRSSGFGEHHGTQDGDESQYLDSRAEFGSSYVYAMTAVVNRTPLVESVFSAEHEVQFADAFPPEPPRELVVLSDVGSARLLWEESDADDLAGYLVYRRGEGGEYAPLFDEPIRRTEYSDRSASSGRTFYYQVVAVDRSGNESEPSEEVRVRIP